MGFLFFRHPGDYYGIDSPGGRRFFGVCIFDAAGDGGGDVHPEMGGGSFAGLVGGFCCLQSGSKCFLSCRLALRSQSGDVDGTVLFCGHHCPQLNEPQKNLINRGMTYDGAV